MKTSAPVTEASLAYAAAQAAHHERKALGEALELHCEILASHPSAPEAEYSRMQVRNIVTAVVPREESFDALLQLARARLRNRDPTEATWSPSPTLVRPASTGARE